MRWRIAMLVLVAIAGACAWWAYTPGPAPEPARVARPKTAKAKDENLTPEQRRQKYVHQAALHIVELEETQPDMGGADLKKRYADLLEREPPLQLEYEAIKAERAKGKVMAR
jgi:hypothetical protein